MSRGQSHVVGVVVLLALGVVTLSLVTAGVGALVDSSAANADATRVADAFEQGLRPATAGGAGALSVPVADGRLHTEDRTLRLSRDGTVVESANVSALVYDGGGHGVTALDGAVVVRTGGGARVRRGFPVTATPELLVVGVAELRGRVDIATNRPTTVRLRTETTHGRRDLDAGAYRLSVETATPGAFERYYRERGVTVEDRTDPDGDGVESVVLAFPRATRVALVTHETELMR